MLYSIKVFFFRMSQLLRPIFKKGFIFACYGRQICPPNLDINLQPVSPGKFNDVCKILYAKSINPEKLGLAIVFPFYKFISFRKLIINMFRSKDSNSV